MPVPISVLDLLPRPSGSSSAQAFANAVELARNTERWGYRRYWIAEHHNTDAFISSATTIVINMIAAATARTRGGSGGVKLPNHSPLQAAAETLTLGSLRPGRIDRGLGRA